MLILASNSPRRKEILTSLNIEFKVISPGVDECSADSCYPEHLSIINAKLKSKTVAENHPSKLVLGADTVVELDGDILEKPIDEKDALNMLMRLSGKQHQVVTAVCLTRRSDYLSIIFAEKSIVEFNVFSREIAEDYMQKVHVLDKAGAYAVQEHGSIIIKKIIGSESNVIGLPIEKLLKALPLSFLPARSMTSAGIG